MEIKAHVVDYEFTMKELKEIMAEKIMVSPDMFDIKFLTHDNYTQNDMYPGPTVQDGIRVSVNMIGK